MSGEDIIGIATAVAADHHAVVTEDHIVSGITLHDVIGIAADKDVVPVIAENRICAAHRGVSRKDPLHYIAAVADDLAVVAQGDIVPTVTVNRISPESPQNDIVIGAAVDYIVAADSGIGGGGEDIVGIAAAVVAHDHAKIA